MNCNCNHLRADHSSDDYDLTERLGKCLIDGCPCMEFQPKIGMLNNTMPQWIKKVYAALEDGR